MTLGPPLWATGSWATNAWADGTWASSVSSLPSFNDLTTVFMPYVASLLAAHAGADDAATQIRVHRPTVVAATSSPDDENTMYAQYCSVNF